MQYALGVQIQFAELLRIRSSSKFKWFNAFSLSWEINYEVPPSSCGVKNKSSNYFLRFNFGRHFPRERRQIIQLEKHIFNLLNNLSISNMQSIDLINILQSLQKLNVKKISFFKLKFIISEFYNNGSYETVMGVYLPS